MEQFSLQWFTAYYITPGLLLVSFGSYLLFKSNRIREYLLEVSEYENPPALWKSVLRYLLLFTLPGIFLSFFPFSWIELLFSVWCLFIVFLLGQLLVLWHETRAYIRKNEETLNRKIRFIAGNMISIGMILFLLCYILLQRTQSI